MADANYNWGGGFAQPTTGWSTPTGSNTNWGASTWGSGFTSSPKASTWGTGFNAPTTTGTVNMGYGLVPTSGWGMGFNAGPSAGYAAPQGGYANMFANTPNYTGFYTPAAGAANTATTGAANTTPTTGAPAIDPMYLSVSGFGMNPYASYLSTPGYGALGGYGPTGALSGQDLSKMAYQYGNDPQALAAAMQRSGVTGADMQEAGVLSSDQYTKMYRPSNQYQGDLNKNQYYQPIYQAQYQNYASPAYASLANANNMGTYNQMAQNTAPRTSFGTAYLMNQPKPTDNTGTTTAATGAPAATTNSTDNAGASTVFGSQKLSSDQIKQQVGDYTKNTAQQNYDLMGKLGLTTKDVATVLGIPEADVEAYFAKGGVNRTGTAYDPTKTYDTTTGTAATTEQTTPKIPEWYTQKDYKYGNYQNFGENELSGFTKDQLNNLYTSKQTAINKDIAQAKLDYAAALKSGKPEFVREAQANLDDKNNQLAKYTADYKAALGALTGAKGTYETKAMTADRLDTTALGALDAAAKKYTGFTAPTLAAGSNAAQIKKAYSSLITTQQTEMANAKKALDALDPKDRPKAIAAAQKYYEAQKADFDKASASLSSALDSFDTSSVEQLGANAKKYTGFTAPTIAANSTDKQIKAAYEPIIKAQKAEVDAAKKALDALDAKDSPKAKAAAQQYYDQQLKDYNDANAALTAALAPTTKKAAEGGLMSLLRR